MFAGSLGARVRRAVFVLAVAAAAAGCEKAQLLAPTDSTIALSAGQTTLALGGSTQLTAVVVESAGTPVQNGTTVRFVASLGRVEPAEAQTRNGVATATFFAGDLSGVADVRALSGGAAGGTGGGTGDATSGNALQITIGGAAVDSVSVTATPTTVPPGGGTVTIVAAALDEHGNRLPNLPITFRTTAGTLSSTTARTDAAGEARVTLTTNRDATITASAGAAEGTVDVDAAIANSIEVETSPNPSVVREPVTATVTPTIGENNTAGRVVLDWGDGTTVDLGLVATARRVGHVYQTSGVFLVTVTQTSGDEVVRASTAHVVNSAGQFGVTITASDATPALNTSTLFTATVSGTATATSYRWTFVAPNGSQSDTTTSGNQVTRQFNTAGVHIVRVTVTLSDGQTVDGETQVNVGG